MSNSANDSKSQTRPPSVSAFTMSDDTGSNKISHARIAELEEMVARREKMAADIRAMQDRMQAMKDKIPSAIEQQLRSSSGASRSTRNNPQATSLGFKDENRALDFSIKSLMDSKAKLEEEIEMLKGWG